MFNRKKIAFIGAGNMAEPIMAGLINKGLVVPTQLIAADVRPERLEELNATLGIDVAASNQAAVAAADVIVLCVKPQYLDDVVPDLKGVISRDSLLLSILAGTKLETLVKSCGHQAVVRSMPNTPAQIGQGMTMWTATEAVTDAQKEMAEAILTAFGLAVYSDKEHHLDMSTALNGSGPGFVFLMLEAMIDAGVHLGLARPVAETLVLQTVIGSAMYAQQSDLHLAQLRNNVTSPGGTTAAGIAALEENSVRASISDAIWAAYKRSVELGNG